jgi:hypothetical protein
MFSDDQLHQFRAQDLIDAVGQLREFYSMHILFSLALFCQNVMLLYIKLMFINIKCTRCYWLAVLIANVVYVSPFYLFCT